MVTPSLADGSDPPPAVGLVVAVYTAPRAGEPVVERERVRARAGRGLEGDRYLRGTGHWSDHRWHHLTLVEAEVVEALAREGHRVEPGQLRRNVVTRGVRLEVLVGGAFEIGDVRLEGLRPCEPCRYLEELLDEPGLKAALRGRGGLRARILEGGVLAPGAPIRGPREAIYENHR